MGLFLDFVNYLAADYTDYADFLGLEIWVWKLGFW